MNRRVKMRLKTVILYIVLTALAAFVLFPFIWMVITALKPRGQEFAGLWFRTGPTLDNFRFIWQNAKFYRYFANSLIVATGAGVVATLISTMAGYAFARKRFWGRDALFMFLLSTMMIPGMMFLIPQFIIVHRLGWINTYWGLFMPHVASVFGVFLVRQFVQSLPQDLFDAATIDGASEWGLFARIVVPLTLPVVATLFLLTFQFQWNNFIWQIIVVNRPDMYTLPVALQALRGQYTADWGRLMAASTFSVVPIALLFVFTQRYFISGMMAGSIKG